MFIIERKLFQEESRQM